MKKRIVLLLCAAICVAAAHRGYANAIAVDNVSIADVSGGMAEIQFDVTCENSWYLSWTDDGGATTITNWDAAWIFLKFKTPGGNWRHAMLTEDGHTAPAGTRIDVGSNAPDKHIGAFLRRAAHGSGTFSAEGVRLRWDFAQSGLGGTTDIDISVHAIEMVYIPEGAFALGSGGNESGRFYEHPTGSNPYWVSSEEAILTGSSAGRLNGSLLSGTIPADFPKGFAAFYCMKYEISQGQYASFLNHLDPGQASVRYPDYYDEHRFTIHLVENEYVADAPDRACNYLSVADLLAYLDWAGLRPMTELEFEKACRGTMLPEPNEYAWGTRSATRITGFNGADGSGDETALPAGANANFRGSSSSQHIDGPARVGIFAEAGSSRQKSGAGYYGVMDLSGNVREQVITAGTAGQGFIPAHGDGSLHTAPDGWPGYTGFMGRGGSWMDQEDRLHTSDRVFGSSPTRASNTGGRGVRTAPEL